MKKVRMENDVTRRKTKLERCDWHFPIHANVLFRDPDDLTRDVAAQRSALANVLVSSQLHQHSINLPGPTASVSKRFARGCRLAPTNSIHTINGFARSSCAADLVSTCRSSKAMTRIQCEYGFDGTTTTSERFSEQLFPSLEPETHALTA